ncbi:cobyrinate a,c-diamide synthase [Butyrivibrio sp. WCD2001]|uniref:cobyrinate a,c-diamide synthase n=1 Tax=Butyrivibrio sp. WCD2001 TaxID=1280681 RepID=UPI0004268374|nr:cobyrinate a,c-diamide synthase [Butyrivibrio sp. WCD2001]
MSHDLDLPRILISAPKSGSGKTLITCAILRLLERKGYKPASFKCGPDYIDPMFHKTVLGIPSRNIDLFLMEEEGIIRALRKGSEDHDIGIIEGVMGYFDGMSATSAKGSSYDISRITGTPAILVVDCKGMSRSILPMVKGFCDYCLNDVAGDSNIGISSNNIKGLFLNNISDHLCDEISELILRETGVPVIGHLPDLKDIEIGSRYLGLVMPSEIPGILSQIYRVCDALEERFDFDSFIEISREAEDLKISAEENYGTKPYTPIRVGVAMDEAFCFYYEDNFDLLREMGAEIVSFSPIHDKELPKVSRLILGGGYPELYAKELSENRSMKESIKNAAISGMPILAECGGFLYLKSSLRDLDGNNFEMADVLPGEAYMTGKLTHFGYVNVSAVSANPYLEVGSTVRGHEYHYYDTTDNGDICDIVKPSGTRSWKGYQTMNNVFAGFAHLYYPSCKEFIRKFLY